MKKALLTLAIAVAGSTAAMANTFQTLQVKDSIATNTHWTADKQYLLMGYVYLTAGNTLTIDSGVIIRGDKNTKGSLIVERGAKIYANGTPTAPIVFTSNQPAGSRFYGDWGGVILCGKSPVNWNGNQAQVEGGPRSLYGGTDATDNSGTMHYVRIEFPGIAFSPNNEINGLTLCGVGTGTQLDHIQVSYSGDDSYEWFGGSVNMKYLIAFRGWDDDWDNDNGWNGKLQFGVSLRDPLAADQSGSKGFESDSYQSGTATGLAGDTSQITKPVFSNMTVVGPLISPTSTAYDNQYVAGVHMRRGSGMSLLNSVVMGWPCGVLFDESASSFGSTTANLSNGVSQLRNNIIAGNATLPGSPTGNKDLFYVKDGARSVTPTLVMADTTTGNPFGAYSGPYNFFRDPAFGNKIYSSATNGVRLTSPFDLSNPNFIPTTTSPIAYNTKGNGSATAGSFNPNNAINTDTTNGYANYNVPQVPPSFNNKGGDAFFTKVNYVGAFAGTQNTSDNWTAGWANWTPTTTDYNTFVNTYHNNSLAVGNVSNNLQNAAVIPNPASKQAMLLVDLSVTSDLQVSVSDLAGRIVLNIYDGLKSAGTARIPFDISSLNAGLYIVRVATNNGVKTIKMSVVR